MDEDYDVYGGAPWSTYHDDVEDAYWQEHDREVATPGFGILAEADRRFFEQQETREVEDRAAADEAAWEERLQDQRDYDHAEEQRMYWQAEEDRYKGLGDFDAGA